MAGCPDYIAWCPDFRCGMGTNRVFGTAKCVHFIEVSSFQGVLNKGFHCTYIHIQYSEDLA